MKLPSSLISYFLAIFLWNSWSVLMFYSEFLNVNIFYFSCSFFSGFFFFFLFQPYMYLWWRFLICCSVCSSWKLSWDRNMFMRVSRGIKDRFGCGQEAHWGNSRGNSIKWNWDSISSWIKPHEDLVEVLIRKWPGHFPRQKYSSCKTSQSQLRNQSSSWKKPHEQLMKKWANFLVKKKITHSKPHEVLMRNQVPRGKSLMRSSWKIGFLMRTSWGSGPISSWKALPHEETHEELKSSWVNLWGTKIPHENPHEEFCISWVTHEETHE